jgi:hypothetical protein
MMDDLYGNGNFHYRTYEEIFLEGSLNFIQSVAQSFFFNEARQFIRFSGHYPHIRSLHICEGATAQLHGDSQQLANLIAFLVTDFVMSRVRKGL